MGVRVPASQFLDRAQAARISAGRYESREIAGALNVTRPGDRVLELGAGIGLAGAVVARNCRPERVEAYEANPALIPAIEALYALNGLQDRIAVKNRILVSAESRPDTLPFHIHANFRSSSLFPAADARRTVEVPTADFNETCAALRPAVLIADIEGAELDLLNHADLSGFRAVVMEFHPGVYGREGLDACKMILRLNGFRPVPEKSGRRVWTCLRAD